MATKVICGMFFAVAITLSGTVIFLLNNLLNNFN